MMERQAETIADLRERVGRAETRAEHLLAEREQFALDTMAQAEWAIKGGSPSRPGRRAGTTTQETIMVGQAAESRVSPTERERILTTATRRYLRGEITYEEHTTIRQRHSLDYIAALTALVRAQQRARAEADLAAERGRSWWRRIFGR